MGEAYSFIPQSLRFIGGYSYLILRILPIIWFTFKKQDLAGDPVWLHNRQIGINRVFYALSMIIYLLNTINPNHTLKQKLEDLFLKYPNVDVAAMGFPVNWRSEPLRKQ